MSERKYLILSEIMIAFTFWIYQMKALEISYKIHEFSSNSNKYWGSYKCFSEKRRKAEKKRRKSGEKAEKRGEKAEKKEKMKKKAEKTLFSYFCLKLPKKLLSRQNNIFPWTQKKISRRVKKLKSYFFLKLTNHQSDL